MIQKKVAIIDYGLCNLFSVEHVCKHVDLKPIITSDYDEIMNSDGVILPGVGAFGRAMEQIKTLKLDKSITDFIKSGKPFLGVCLGLHLLFDESEEMGSHKGLEIIAGKVKKIPDSCGRVPNIGWNNLEIAKKSKLLEGATEDMYMYFVHSFFAEPTNKEDVLTYSLYEGLKYCSSIQKDNIFACQFHPEKSAENGVKIYQNFKEIIEKYNG